MVGVSFVIFIYYLSGFVYCTEKCPKICSCLGDYLLCAEKDLYIIPKIPSWTGRLNLNNNYIKALDGSTWKNVTHLKELKLNKNKISRISKDAFTNQTSLILLEMNRNQLVTIEALTFTKLQQLTILKLKRNRISELQDGAFFGLIKIKSLKLDYNFIEIISKGWLYGLDALKELSLNHNNINHIESDAWEFCQDLNDLDLSFNNLTAIRKDTLKYLRFLQKLSLNNNQISFIEDGAFANTPDLKMLQISKNKISLTIEDSSGVFKHLMKLHKFYLASNDIKSINKNAFIGLNNVVTLDLSKNNITTIQKSAFSEMPFLQDLQINTSSLLCDCNLRWFYDWLKNKKFKLYTVCAHPEWLRNQSLLDVPPTNFTCGDLVKPRLIDEPEPEIMALKGENISLSCKAMSNSPSTMTFYWKKDNVDLTNANISVKTVTDKKNTEIVSVLNIYKVQHSDAGKYQCVVSNNYGITYSQKSNISVLIFPTFVKTPQNVTVASGTTVRLECAAHGEPQPEIAWQKDGGNDFPAARERRIHVMHTDDVFFIMGAKPADMGIYSCTAHNPAGTIVANATLTIEEKPYFGKPMENKEITAGESVVLQCMSGGAPKPSIQWLKDGAPILATERHFFTAEDQLMIIVDTVLSDAGTYECRLNNSLGTQMGYSELLVKPGIISESDKMGIIIITVVCCAVATSIVWVVIIYQTHKRMRKAPANVAIPEIPRHNFTEKTNNQFGDDISEHSSCKDSGTGDSAKRSNDDLLPTDEYAIIIKEIGPSESSSTMRAASLVCLSSDRNNSHTPLLYDRSFLRSTNHDRSQESDNQVEKQYTATAGIA